jgi:Ca2+-binding EF-hand superfamily protein
MATPLPPSAGTRAQEQQKQAAAEAESKRLLLLMDTDKNGTVSKQEWMSFIEKEFDRLDFNHDGQINVKELTQSQLQIHQPYTAVGK